MRYRFFLFFLLILSQQILLAQCPGVCIPLAYEGFQYSNNAPLHDQVGGSGWGDPWWVQGYNTDFPGYQINTGNLAYSDLQTAGGFCSGGNAYLSTGRLLNTSASGPFNSYLEDGYIKNPGTALYMSALLRKDVSDDHGTWLSLHWGNVPWLVESARVGFGYFGANSNSGGNKYWTLRVEDNYYLSSVPVTIGTEALLVVKIEFGANDQHNFSFWVNPSTIGANEPTPDLTQSVTATLNIRAIGFYGGPSAGWGAIDEIRISDTYQCTVPDAATSLNQLPLASFTVSQTDAQVPFTSNFNASASSDPDGSISSYSWQFGDGGSSFGTTPSYTFEHSGYLQTILTVTDNCGSQQSAQALIKARDSNNQFSCNSAVYVNNLVTSGQSDGQFSFTSSIGDTYTLVDNSNNTYNRVGATYSNLPAQDYTFTVTGPSGCMDVYNLNMPVDESTGNGWTPDPCDHQFGINIDGAPYWNVMRPFKDLKKESGEFFTADVAAGSPWDSGVMSEIPVDSDGYPTSLPYTTSRGATYVRCMISAQNHMPPGDYILLYDGSGTINLYGNVTINSNVSGRIEFTLAGSDNQWFQIESSQNGNHIRNIRIIRPEHESNYISDPWYNPFLYHLNKFQAIRFMDWGHTNGSEIVNWSERQSQTYHTQSRDNGIAYEYMIDLANHLQKDIWVCVPHQASDNYITQMANLFKDNLNSNLTIYIEYSNEVWNWSFSQASWVYNNGPSHWSHPRQYAERARNVFEIWHSVFSGQTTRVKRVLGTQSVNPWLGQEAMGQLKGEFDYLSPTWYFGYSGASCESSLNAGSTALDVLTCSENNWESQVTSMRQHYWNARLYGKGVIEYEGGQHMTSNPVSIPFQQAVYDAQVHPYISTVYQRVIDSLRYWKSDLTMHFTLSSVRESIYGSWGLLEDIDQNWNTQSAPKYNVVTSNINCYTPPVSVALPAELIDFQVFGEDCKSTLRWITATEINNRHFEVQRSMDGQNFESIQVISGKGDSQEYTYYNYIDPRPLEGKSYYRLKQVDWDGSIEFSEIRLVENKCKDSTLLVFPNPTSNSFTIQIRDVDPSNSYLIEVINPLGQQVHTEYSNGELISNGIVISMVDFPKGIYNLNVFGKTGLTYKSKIVKQ